MSEMCCCQHEWIDKMDGVLSFYYIIKLVIVFASISFLLSLSYDDSFFPVSTFSLSFI